MNFAIKKRFRKTLFDFLWRLRAGSANPLSQAGRIVRTEGDEDQYRKIAENINAQLELKSSDLLVDMGCSNGALIENLAGFVGRAYLIDRSAEQLNLAVKRLERFSSKITFINADITDTKLPGQLSDKILVCGVVQYLDSLDHFERALSELYRILKVGAVGLIADIPISALERANGRWNEKILRPIYVSYSEDWLLSVSEKIGFDAQINTQPAGLPFSKTRIDLLLKKR